MRVKMIPYARQMGGEESGIKRVVEAYEKFGPAHGIQFVDPDSDDYEVLAVHAGMTEQFPSDKPLVSICHGLYWTDDYRAQSWEWRTNAKVIFALRMSKIITVPSFWVGETFRRDMHVAPIVVPHGIEWKKWQHDIEPESFILWNKNRAGDVCDPRPVATLAGLFPKMSFYMTVTNDIVPPNVKIIGLQPHGVMQKFIQRAGVYLSTTKETFGIGVLEALASGTPVLGFDFGGNRDLIKHGVNGYLARVNDYEDLKNGLEYCLTNRKILSENAVETVKEWTWDRALEELKLALDMAAQPEQPTVGVVIPTYNYADKVERAIKSAAMQTHAVDRIIVVDDGSTDDGETQRIVWKLSKIDKRVRYIRQDNAGVAIARNNGIDHCHTKYIICLDADDAIDPQFVEACLPELEKNRSLGIAYTGLLAIKPNGEQGVSPWPTDFDYDLQLQRHNQIPTCCMFRRIIWERLAGYRQRYAPHGAGSEDAEFWLRAGALGFDAMKVTDAPLFIYSWLSGRVSGNRQYQEVDWLAWHPWVEDKHHPFASVASPKHLSHPVRQYDEPMVSVIIPVSASHKKEVINALDSLEAQIFRKWEAIVVEDAIMPDFAWRIEISKAFPFVRFAEIEHTGAGAARNAGAKIARSQFLLFLDADDWLYPEAIQRMIERWESSQAIVYSDYVSKADLEPEYARSLGDKLLFYDEKTRNAVIKNNASNYDCARASQQPDPSDMYIWNLITSLVPKTWHNEIGGFDEKMESWEDWDYWLRMARSGKCFNRIEEPLVVYRFYTGTRRELGVREHQNLIEYLQSKYAKETLMPCHCGGGQGNNGSAVLNQLANRAEQINRATTAKGNGNMAVNDDDLVLCNYEHANRGQHMVIGAATQIAYGYRGGGEKFLVHRSDIDAQPHLFRPIVVEATAPMQAQEATPPPKSVASPEPQKQTVAVAEKEEEAEQEVIEAETLEVEAFDLTMLPGVTEEIAKQLQAHGVQTLEDISEKTPSDLLQIKGIGPSRADAILTYAKEKLAEQNEK